MYFGTVNEFRVSNVFDLSWDRPLYVAFVVYHYYFRIMLGKIQLNEKTLILTSTDF